MLNALLAIVFLLTAAPKAVRPPAKPGAAASRSELKLKAGAEGPLCLQCHIPFKDQLEKAFVHTPVRTQECIGCHSPHASRHGKLLAEDKSKVCLTCHTKLLPKEPKSTHKPVAEGSCVGCHDPHASAN